jgi:hypothetical protein
MINNMPPTIIYYTKPGVQPTISDDLMATILNNIGPTHMGNYTFRLGSVNEVPDHRRKMIRLSLVNPDTRVIIIE